MSDAKGAPAKETFSLFDVVDYLDDEETIAEYMVATAERGDPAVSVIAAANVAKARKRLRDAAMAPANSSPKM